MLMVMTTISLAFGTLYGLRYDMLDVLAVVGY